MHFQSRITCLEQPYNLMKDLKSISHTHSRNDVMKHSISCNTNNKKRTLFFLSQLSVGSPSIDIVSVYLVEQTINKIQRF